MAKKSQKISKNNKRFDIANNKKTQLVAVALVFGVLGVATLQFSGASPLSDRLRSLLKSNKSTSGGSQRFNFPPISCNGGNGTVRTGDSNATGNNMRTIIRQGGNSGVTVNNRTTTTNNTGGQVSVGC